MICIGTQHIDLDGTACGSLGWSPIQVRQQTSAAPACAVCKTQCDTQKTMQETKAVGETKRLTLHQTICSFLVHAALSFEPIKRTEAEIHETIIS
jgi:sRNA-binding protein